MLFGPLLAGACTREPEPDWPGALTRPALPSCPDFCSIWLRTTIAPSPPTSSTSTATVATMARLTPGRGIARAEEAGGTALVTVGCVRLTGEPQRRQNCDCVGSSAEQRPHFIRTTARSPSCLRGEELPFLFPCLPPFW